MDETNLTTTNSEMNRHSLASLLLGIGVGALVGVVAAMLLTPQSGQETREDLEDISHKVRDRADEMVQELKQNLDELAAKSRELVDSTRDRLDTAMQAGKEAAGERRDELESRLQAEDPA